MVAPPTQYVLLNGSTALSCLFRDMTSVVIWKFGGSDGPVVDGTIEAASWADEGVYLCRLSNSEVEAVMRDIELRIVGEDASCTCSHRLQGGGPQEWVGPREWAGHG